MARIGLFPGTFDPIHEGHVTFAMAAMAAAHLDKVVFLPERLPRGKEAVTPLDHRRRMIDLVIHRRPQLAVVVLPDDQFTVQKTLPQFEQLWPHDELWLLVGSDIVGTFQAWPDVDELFRRVKLLVGVRSDDQSAALQAKLARLEDQIGVKVDHQLIATTAAAVASTHLRQQPTSPHLARSVADYISAHGLYGGELSTNH